MKKVLIWSSGENKKKIFVKWVQFLKWHHKFDMRKGRKSQIEQKYGQWVVPIYSSVTFIDFWYSVT